MSCSFGQSVEAIALAAITRAPDIGDFAPCGAGRVELVRRRALDEKQAAGLRMARVERARPQAGVVVERRALRQAEEALGDAAGTRRDACAQLQRHRAVALLEIG